MSAKPLAKPEWAGHFQIDDATWETLCSQATRQKASSLDVALDMGLLNEVKLLEWDRARSGLATIRATFFTNPAPMDLFQGQSYEQCRAQACMPVGRWDGKEIWAKLSSDQEQPQGISAIWVLAPWSGMKLWFAQWQSVNQAKQVPDPTEAALPTFEPIELQSNSDVSLSLMPVTEQTPTPIEIPEATQVSITKIDMTAPLNLSLDMPAALPEIPKMVMPEIPQMPEAPKIDTKDALATLDFSNLMPPIPAHKSPTPSAAVEPAPLPPPLPQTNPSIKLPPPIMVAPPPLHAPAMPAPATIKSEGVPTIAAEELPSKLKGANNLDDLLSAMLGGWKNYFDQVMILLFQSNQLIMLRWHGDWKGTITKGETINLDSPSIFKIVGDSGQPYHGYVSPGPVNDAFFKKTNGGNYPEHVTVMPVIVEKRVAAMVFGSCSKLAGKALHLPRLEEHSAHLASGLLRLLPLQKAG